MGWFSGYPTRKGMVAELVEGWTRTTDDGLTVTSTCLASCFRGQPTHYGILWSVWEQTFTRDGLEEKPPERFIKCDLMECWARDGRRWAYKPMEESCGPYYWNCPEKYLQMVPVVANQEWRDGVADYHRQRREKLAQKRAAKIPLDIS